MKKFLPDNFKLKTEYKFKNFKIRKMKISDNPDDFKAVIDNAKLIEKVRGGRVCHEVWPDPNFTLEDNLKDVKDMIEDFEKRTHICMLIKSLDDKEYLGCLYLFPITYKYPDLADKYDLDFSMFVTKRPYNDGEYPMIYKTIWEWLKTDLPFEPKRIFHRNAEVPIKISKM